MKKKIDRIKIKLGKKDKLFLLETKNEGTTYLHNMLKGVDKVVIEIEREEG